MPLLKRNNNKPLVPPLESEKQSGKSSSSPRPSYRSNAATYVPSRDGNLYEKSTRSDGDFTPPEDSYRDKYSRGNSVGDVYSRGDAQLDQDRNELFSGYNPAKSGGSGRFFDGPRGRDVPPGEENDEDTEGIKQQTKFVKQESVNSARNALRLAREAEDVARGTLGKLGDQSEKLANTEMHLDVAKGHSSRASDKTDELKKLNRSIFRPVVTWNKDAKRAAEEAKVQARYEDQRLEREKAMRDIRDTQNRLGQAQTYGRAEEVEELTGGRRFKTAEQLSERKAHRARYQFEATASDDELENELDDNLDEIGDATKRLKALGMAMGQELESQNTRIDNISGKTEGLDDKLYNVTHRVSALTISALTWYSLSGI
ncbi:protein transporter SEC9 [Desarmillaria ectypa]|nr:protein transporter SEC9 [Desarmillaria ectypa]